MAIILVTIKCHWCMCLWTCWWEASWPLLVVHQFWKVLLPSIVEHSIVFSYQFWLDSQNHMFSMWCQICFRVVWSGFTILQVYTFMNVQMHKLTKQWGTNLLTQSGWPETWKPKPKFSSAQLSSIHVHSIRNHSPNMCSFSGPAPRQFWTPKCLEFW